MWIKLQIYEKDKKSMLGIVFAATGHYNFRATDVIALMGWEKNPWSQLRRYLPESLPVETIVPVPMSYGNMRVVDLEQMLKAVKRVATTGRSLFLRTRNANLHDYLVRMFFDPARVVKKPVHYASNVMKAQTVKIVWRDESDTQTLNEFLNETRERFLQMYGRLVPVRQAPQNDEGRLDEGRLDEGELVIDEDRLDEDRLDKDWLSDDDATMPADSETSAAEFKIFSKIQPPESIVWFDGKATYLFRCTKFICRGPGGEKMTLFRNQN